MKRIPWLAAAGLAGFAAGRLAEADRSRRLEAPAAPLLSFTPQAAGAALLGAAVLRRHRAVAAATALSGMALAGVVRPRTVARPQPPAEGPALRLLTANLLAGRASEEAVVALARRQGTDVLCLQELTEPAVARLKQAGLADLLPYEMTDVRGESTRGSGIYSRFPLAEGPLFDPTYAAQPRARLALPGGQWSDLICIHTSPPNPPTRARVARWREELAMLPPPSGPAGPPLILAGDFNATADHVAFRRVLGLGHVDAAAASGRGLVPTWGPWAGGGPGLLTIDHILVDPRCAVLAVGVYRLPGSDHRALSAQLRLPGAPGAPGPVASGRDDNGR